jgi:DnaJ-class molecular chaperone
MSRVFVQLHPESDDNAVDVMERLGQAYEVLTDPSKRSAYDDRRYSHVAAANSPRLKQVGFRRHHS